MSAFGDHPPTARMGLALVLANARYWTRVAPLTRSQLDYWVRRAEKIPDPELKDAALTSHREESFNAQATATLATLAPPAYRKSVVEAIVGLQVIYDYLDRLLERPLTDPLGTGRHLYQALIDAIALDTEPNYDYYTSSGWSHDGRYLQELVDVVRKAIARLPRRAAIAETSERAAVRCAEAQVRAHATVLLGDTQLEAWATGHAHQTGLGWREYLAGAVSSGLALHALIATAADPRTSPAQAVAIDKLYLPICALTTLLDGLIDYEQDMRDTGQPGYVRYYEDHDALRQGLTSMVDRAVIHANDVPNRAYHLMTLVGVAAYYTSSPTASSELARPITQQIIRDLRPLVTPTLALMRAWRVAKQVRITTTRPFKR